MEESVALDSSKQKQFVKSVRGIKKLLKTKKCKNLETLEPAKKIEVTKDSEPKKKLKSEKLETKIKKKKEAKTVETKTKNFKKIGKRGLVYLSHIPHGFYEHQMTEYFKQFGVVTNARVIRSRRTGNSKGYAFVEFKEPSVAEIVAETMNNYLMGQRLIKAVYIPPEKQKLYALRKNWNYQNNPAREQTLKMKKVINADKSDQEEISLADKLLSSLTNTKKKLKCLGIDYDFFMPVDIPDTIKEKIKQNGVDVGSKSPIKSVTESKKKINEDNTMKAQQNKNKTMDSKNKIVSVKKKQELNNIKKKTKINENQKLEESKLKAAENINNSADDNSNDSVEFDSDEFEKMLENEDDDLSSESTSDDFNEEIIQKEEIVNVKITAQAFKKESSKITPTQVCAEKRKKITNAPVTPKKAKFEKQSKQTLNRVVKKKNKD